MLTKPHRFDTKDNHRIYCGYMKTLISIKTDKGLLRKGRVDFVLPLVPNKKTVTLIRRAREDYKKGRNISPVFENAEDAIAYLHE